MMVVEGTPLSKGVNNTIQGHSNPSDSHPNSSVISHPNNLIRPRSVDDLLNGSGASPRRPTTNGSSNDPHEPALEDLAESEVFVGSEDEDDEEHLRPDCQPTSLTISYHDEPRLPLHAVKEEVEAEEAEEAAMSLQMSTQSIIPTPVPSSSSNITLGISTSPLISNRMMPSTSSLPIMSQTNPINSMNFINNEISRLSQDSASNMSQSVEMANIADINNRIRFGSEVISKMSKSVDVLEDDPCDQIDSNVVMNGSSYIDNIPQTTSIGNNGLDQQEIDLTDGIPSLGDLSCSGIDEGVNLDNSPYSEGSPLSHSLASSVTSNMSLDDTLSSRTDTSSYTDTQDTVVAIVQKNPCSRLPHKETQSRISTRSGRPISGKGSQTSAGNKSLHLIEPSQKTPECRRRSTGVASPRLDALNKNSTYSKIGTSSSRNSPRLSDRSAKVEDRKKIIKAAVHDRRTCRNNSSMGTTVASRSKVAELDYPRKCRADSKYETKDSKLSEPKSGTLERKKKEKNVKDDEYDSSTLGRRKKKQEKDVANEIPRSWNANDNKDAEKYGTLGRRKKVREAGDGREEAQGGLTKENKDTLDTYATLPRRKAREMTARWREQNLQAYTEGQSTTIPHISIQPSETTTRPLRRSRSIGKGESSRSISSYSNNSSNFVRCAPRPSPRLSQTNSPVPSPRPAIATQTPRKERTIICLETAIQTALVGHEVAAAMRALARVRSQDEKTDPRPKIEIIRDYPLPLPPKPKPTHCDAQLQVDVGWGICSCGARRELARSSECEELQRLLKEERQAKDEVQGELDRTSQKIRDMLSSMEGVEKEFNQRCDSLVVLESQLQHSTQYNSKLQDRLSQYEDYTLTMRKDLCSCQERERLLQQQVTDLESESRELAEFMGSEKEALTECLREAESESGRLRQLCDDRDTQIQHREQEATVLARLAEERRTEIETLSGELNNLQGRTRDLMVCQGAQVSSAAVTLSNLAIRLQALTARLVHDYSVTEDDLQNIVTPSESDSSASSSATNSPEHKAPSSFAPRSILAGLAGRAPSPRKPPASFIHAVLHALRGGPHTTSVLPFSQSKEKSSEVAADGGKDDSPSSDGSVSLVDQVSEVDVLLSRFLKVCCVLKNDTDAVLNEVQEENERLAQEVRRQQQLIEQQQSDYEALTRAETRAQRQLAAVTRARDKSAITSDVRRSLSMDCEASSLHDAGDVTDKVWGLRGESVGPPEKASALQQEQGQSCDKLESPAPLPSPQEDASAKLVMAALQTLDSLPEVLSTQPSLKHLYNSLKVHSLTSNGCQPSVNSDEINPQDFKKQCRLQANLCSSNGVLGISINGNGPKSTENDDQKYNAVVEQISTNIDIIDAKESKNLNIAVNGSSTGGIVHDNDRTNGNASVVRMITTPDSLSNSHGELVFDLNANPPTYVVSPQSTAEEDPPQSSPPSTLPSTLDGHAMLSPSNRNSPNGITSPHSPRIQKSPLSSSCSPHSSPISDHVTKILPGVRSPVPILVQTETHL